ncbi:MAG: VOC family protein [Gammaproteobacteria bacterium]|nr:VOC family protein [Gammaproteobacteria bacterium]
MDTPITSGVHHIGLTVSKLEESADFFTSLLGWKEVRRNEDYPAIYVSDSNILVTLWGIKEQPPLEFNRMKNIGLHHVAFRVESERDLESIYGKLLDSSIKIEFSPEQLGQGPAKHMICYEPSGVRVEFIWLGS